MAFATDGRLYVAVFGQGDVTVLGKNGEVVERIQTAGKLPTSTVIDALMIMSGGPTQTHMSVTRAWGIFPVSTVTQQGGRIGPPTCGTIPVTIGQTCMSPMREAGIPIGATFVSGREAGVQFKLIFAVHATRQWLVTDFGSQRAGHQRSGRIMTRARFKPTQMLPHGRLIELHHKGCD